MAITPTREQFSEFAHGARDGEVVMINLLHFARADDDTLKDNAAAKDDAAANDGAATGAHAYRDYSDQVVKMVEARGGKVIWTGRPEHVLIGDSAADAWDLVALRLVPEPGRVRRHGHVAQVRGGPHRPRAGARPHRAARVRAGPRCAAAPGCQRGRGCLTPHRLPPPRRAAATSCSSPPTSSATTVSAATAGRWPARPWSTGWRPRASTTGAPTTRTPCACPPGRPCSPASTCARTAWWPTASLSPSTLPSVAQYLHDTAGYRTALLGKAHFEPGFDPTNQFEENARVARGDTGPWRGFERSQQAMHAAAWGNHPIADYGRWLKEHHPEHLHSFAGLLQAEPGGDTAAPETKNNPIPRAWYHTDWVADLTIDWLQSLAAEEPWFCWMSFPDPHHPWDPPASELPRVPWRDLALPPGHPGSDDAVRAVPGPQAAALARLLGGSVRQHGGRPGGLRPLDADPRSDPRGQREGPRDERAHRRGLRARAAVHCGPRAGCPTPTSSSPPTTGSCRATSASSSRARTTPTR